MIKCYLDTMTLIHFKRFDTLDWQSILDTSEEVSLIITPIVLRELNKKKDSDQNKGIRKRSGDILKVLEKYQDNGEIKKGVNLNFISIEPQVDWKAIGLDSEIADDRLIASMLNEEDISKLRLVTSDFGLKLKAKLWEIKIVKLDDSFKEAVRVDEDEKKIKELEKKIAHYENASPKLGLYVQPSNDTQFYEIEYQEVPDIDPVTLEEEIKELRKALNYNSYGKLGLGVYAGLASVTGKEIKRYSDDVEKYITAMRDFFQNQNRYENFKSRLFSLNIVLSNVGGKPASDIDIIMHFPDGFMILSEDDLEELEEYKEPEEPKKPIGPRLSFGLSAMESLARFSQYDYELGTINVPNLTPMKLGVDYSLVSIEKADSYKVHFKVEKLKQKSIQPLDPLYLLFDSYESIKSFHFEYVINTENHPDEFEGKLNIKFKLVE